MEVTTKQLMEIFRVTSKSTPSEWRKSGASVAYIKRDTWDLGEFIQWWAETVYFPKDNKHIADHRERFEKERADGLELKNAQTRGDLLPKQDVEQAVSELITLAKKGFMILPKSAPSVLYGKTEVEMMESLTKMVLQILSGMARGATVEEITKKITS